MSNIVVPEVTPAERAAAVAEAFADIVPTPTIIAQARILREYADSVAVELVGS